MSPSGIQVNKGAIAVIFLVVSGIVLYKNYDTVSHFLFKGKKMEHISGPQVIPDSIVKDAESLEVKGNTITVKGDGKDLKILTREVKPKEASEISLLFLHGMRFSSQNWVNIKTLTLMAALGYHSVAVDLPEGMETKSDKADLKDKSGFLENLVAALKIKSPVIISPSMSGSFSLPYLFKDPATVLTRSKAYVPVAPVNTEKYTQENYKSLHIPTSIICGENDKEIGPVSVQNLKNIPESTVHMIKGAGHAAYLDKPQEFHNIMYTFLKGLLTKTGH